MRILAIADQESAWLWDYFEKEKLEGIDLIVSCGDLNPNYLSFLATFCHGPVLYVHGNHDDRYEKTPPEGCTCIDGKVFEYEGVRFLGLGGSMRYNYGHNQYTQRQMSRRVSKLWFPLLRHKGFDILVTHAPAYDITDLPDLPHRGFQVFTKLMERFSPRYMLHGHVHMSYGRGVKRLTRYKDTIIINAFERYIFEI